MDARATEPAIHGRPSGWARPSTTLQPHQQNRYTESVIGTMYSSNVNEPSGVSGDHPQIKKLAAMEVVGTEASGAFRNHRRRWPGVVAFVVMILTAIALISYGSVQTYHSKLERAKIYQEYLKGERTIKDGLSDGSDLVSDDGQIGNPKSYDVNKECHMPNYQSKQGKIYAVAPNGTEVPIQIKGVNWFGMETGLAIVYGLWENAINGTTAYEVASFLARNNFNAVRLPISVENIRDENPPKPGVINTATNRAFDIQNFTSTLQSVVKALAYREIGVLISMHTLTNKESGGNWYSEKLGVTKADFLDAIGAVTKALCHDDYWNVMGIDLKNEPETATWGTGEEDDFVIGAEKIAKKMLDGCPKWLGFVEGIVGDSYTVEIEGQEFNYYNWWGGGLQGARTAKPDFGVDHKLVWAPHYYTTAVSPQMYFYGNGTSPDYHPYVELDDDMLLARVNGTMTNMFGYLIDDPTEYALLLGEFAGLYVGDTHPNKTIQRTTEMTIKVIMKEGYEGGFMWSLNPESSYQYSDAATKGSFTEGLLEDDWLTTNQKFLDAFEPMNKLPHLSKFPCFEKKGDGN